MLFSGGNLSDAFDSGVNMKVNISTPLLNSCIKLFKWYTFNKYDIKWFGMTNPMSFGIIGFIYLRVSILILVQVWHLELQLEHQTKSKTTDDAFILVAEGHTLH